MDSDIIHRLEAFNWEVAKFFGPPEADLVSEAARTIRNCRIVSEELMCRISAVEQRVREAQIVGLRSAIDIIRSARDHHDPTDPISTELDEIIHDVEMVIQRELERTWR